MARIGGSYVKGEDGKVERVAGTEPAPIGGKKPAAKPAPGGKSANGPPSPKASSLRSGAAAATADKSAEVGETKR